jgi:hypothetical protein
MRWPLHCPLVVLAVTLQIEISATTVEQHLWQICNTENSLTKTLSSESRSGMRWSWHRH